MPEIHDAPEPPDVADSLIDRLRQLDPDALEAVSEWTADLSRHRRRIELIENQRRADEGVDESELDDLESRFELEPPDSGAYITVKTTKSTPERDYQYFYWQWREGDSWKNEYIGPVDSSG